MGFFHGDECGFSMRLQTINIWAVLNPEWFIKTIVVFYPK